MKTCVPGAPPPPPPPPQLIWSVILIELMLNVTFLLLFLSDLTDRFSSFYINLFVVWVH